MAPADGDTRLRFALILRLAFAAFFLFTEHRSHLYGLLPYLPLLARPFTQGEERYAPAKFGETYQRYAAVTPRFNLRFRRLSQAS